MNTRPPLGVEAEGGRYHLEKEEVLRNTSRVYANDAQEDEQRGRSIFAREEELCSGSEHTGQRRKRDHRRLHDPLPENLGIANRGLLKGTSTTRVALYR